MKTIILIGVSYFAWSAFHSGTKVLDYVILTFLMDRFSYEYVISYILESYRTGNVVFDLVRPIPFKETVLWRWIGTVLSDIVLLLLLFIAIFLIPNMQFLIAVILAVYIRYLVGVIFASITYSSYYSWGIGSMLGILTYITGGGLPYFLMPEFIKQIMWFNPLFYCLAAPWVAVNAPAIIFVQIALIVILTIVAKYLTSRMIQNFTTVGV